MMRRKRMNEITQSDRIAAQRLLNIESPARRSVMKAMAGFGATLASSSLSPAIAVQAQSHQPGAPGNQVSPVQDGWGPFTPSSGAGRYLQLAYPPSTTKGELQLGAVYTLWIPDDIKIVRAVIVHQHGASIPAAQAGATSAYDLHWQALAKKWNCVLLGPSYHVLNDAIDLTPGGAELWFDPRRVLSVFSCGPWTSLRQSRATRKSLRPHGVSGDTLVAGYGPM